MRNDVEYDAIAAREKRHAIRMRGTSRWRTWLLRERTMYKLEAMHLQEQAKA